MAQFFFDFRNRLDILGETPPECLGWLGTTLDTVQCRIRDDLDVISGFDTALFFQTPSAMRFDGVPLDAADSEIVMLIRVGNLSASTAIQIRTTGVVANKSGYCIDARRDGRQINRRQDATDSIGNAIISDTGNLGFADGLRIHRLKADGTTIGTRVTDSTDPADELSAWSTEVTDATHAAGAMGIWMRSAHCSIAWVGCGTGGDPAPTEAVSGGGATLITTDVTALLQKQRTLTSAINAQLAKNIVVTLDVDAVLAQGRILITDIDGYLQQRVLLTITADAILGGLSTIVTQVDAYLQRSVSILTDIDALLTAPQTAQTIVDSVLQLRRELTTTVEALLSKTQSVVTAADAVLIEAGVTVITTEVNALLSKMRNIVVTSDALLSKAFNTQTTIDSILQTKNAVTAVINAVVQKAQLITLLADSVLFDADAPGFQGTAGGFNLSQPSVNFAAGRSISFGTSRSFILDNPRGFRRSS